jgi:hypothetical protein
MSLWLHAALCVTVPAAWGVVMFWAFSFVRRRREAHRADDPPPIDYSI